MMRAFGEPESWAGVTSRSQLRSRALEKAVELDPQNEQLKRQLDQLKGR
jgi:hypothetical protein